MSDLHSVQISAPGKVILHGDHSVVYGKLAIAASINKSTNLSLTLQTTPKITLVFHDINLNLEIPLQDIQNNILDNGILPLQDTYSIDNPDSLIFDDLINKIKNYLDNLNVTFDVSQTNALLAFLYLYLAMYSPVGLKNGLFVNISSDLTIGAGLGSSASFSVCIAGGFIQLLKLQQKFAFMTENTTEFNDFEKDLIRKWAFQAERVMHGNPSGLDNTICTYGGFVEYRKGVAPKPLDISTNLQLFEALLINTNVPKNTRVQVEKVARFKEQFPGIVEHILDTMEEISKNAIESMKSLFKGDLDREYRVLNTLYDVNQNMLRSLGVSHAAIEKVCAILSEFDLHAKITGAGGGGYVLCLVPNYISESVVLDVQNKLENVGFTSDRLNLGVEGVHLLK